MSQKPSIGRTVHYIVNYVDVAQINRRRTSAQSISDRIEKDEWPIGAQAHIGNSVYEGQHLPMLITAVFGSSLDNITVNGQVFLDGNDTFWVNSASEGEEPGSWHWPERE
jgi:hypothetical protein